MNSSNIINRKIRSFPFQKKFPKTFDHVLNNVVDHISGGICLFRDLGTIYRNRF